MPAERCRDTLPRRLHPVRTGDPKKQVPELVSAGQKRFQVIKKVFIV